MKRYVFVLLSTMLLVQGCGSSFKTLKAVPTPVVLPTGNNKVQVNWTAPTTGTPDSYSVTASPDGSTFFPVGTALGSASSAVISGLGSGTLYFRVYAVNSIGATSSTNLVLVIP